MYHAKYLDMSYYNSVKNGRLNSFLASGYEENIMEIIGYNEFNLNEHINEKSRIDA